MSSDTIMPAATNKVAQSMFRNRLSVNERFNSFHVSRRSITSAFINMLDRCQFQT